MDMDAYKVQNIIGDNPRFVSPFSEPCSFYIWTREKENIHNIYLQKYWEKLKYMSENIDILIQQAFKAKFYNFYGVNQNLIASSDEMCQR